MLHGITCRCETAVPGSPADMRASPALIASSACTAAPMPALASCMCTSSVGSPLMPAAATLLLPAAADERPLLCSAPEPAAAALLLWVLPSPLKKATPQQRTRASVLLPGGGAAPPAMILKMPQHLWSDAMPSIVTPSTRQHVRMRTATGATFMLQPSRLALCKLHLRS